MKTIAHVGWNRSGDDKARTTEAAIWMLERGLELPNTPDYINLSKGRDFLAEDLKYDAVILHFIFRGGFCINKKHTKRGQLAVSPMSSWSGWRKRLAATGAKFVFAFGGIAEIGGTFLCDVPGYSVHKIRTEDASAFGKRETGYNGLWIFQRNP